MGFDVLFSWLVFTQRCSQFKLSKTFQVSSPECPRFGLGHCVHTESQVWGILWFLFRSYKSFAFYKSGGTVCRFSLAWETCNEGSGCTARPACYSGRTSHPPPLRPWSDCPEFHGKGRTRPSAVLLCPDHSHPAGTAAWVQVCILTDRHSGKRTFVLLRLVTG